MNIEKEVFQKYSPDFKKLIQYGFKQNNDKYEYEKLFLNKTFKAMISISKSEEVFGTVYDMESKDEFLPLRTDNQQGAFVGKVREEYRKLLTDIRDKCFKENYFVFPQANRIANAIIKKYGDKPDFMWKEFPNYAVFKNPDNGKWYGIVMNTNRSNFGFENNIPIEIVVIKQDKTKIPELLKQKGYYPAWHMNKKSWITIILDDTLPDKEILNLIENSHSMTVGTKKEWIVPANPKYFDLEAAFHKENEIIWKQSSNINKGDITYMYVTAPISAILYKCKVTEVNIPYDYKDKNLKITKVMKIKLLKRYDKNFMNFEKLNKYGITTIRGQRTCPEELCNILK